MDQTVKKKGGGLKVFFATSFNLGTLPGPGGTWGTLPALGLHLGLIAAAIAWNIQLGIWAGVFLLCMVSAPALVGAACKHYGLKDPKQVTLDELAGYALGACLLMNHSWSAAGSLFVLFRVFDALKPWPISRLEKFPGVWGVMADDLGAGLVAGGMVLALQWQGVMP